MVLFWVWIWFVVGFFWQSSMFIGTNKSKVRRVIVIGLIPSHKPITHQYFSVETTVETISVETTGAKNEALRQLLFRCEVAFTVLSPIKPTRKALQRLKSCHSSSV